MGKKVNARSSTLVVHDDTSASGSEISGRTLLAGVALISFGTLLLELGLTRVYSVVLFYHFAFLAISIALLGLGAGGVFAHLSKNKLAKFSTRTIAGRLCLANAIIVLLVLETLLHIPITLQPSAQNILRLGVLYLTSGVPFFFSGLMLSVVYARESGRIPSLYGADLMGGALACLTVVPLLNLFGGPNTIIFAGVAVAIAAVVWTDAKSARNLAVLVAAGFLVAIAANHSNRLFDVAYAKGKPLSATAVEFSRWNAISRVELYRSSLNMAVVLIDSDAATVIMHSDPNESGDGRWKRDLMSSSPAVANVLRPHGKIAIIGPGGGTDVLRAVVAGSSNVTGIEINPTIATTIMRERYADFAYHLYERPEVHIQVTDGRSFLRSTPEHFDVVQLTMVDTWASTAAGAFALSENNLYTVEAFQEYFEHLNPGGMIAITRWEFSEPHEALRVVSLAMAALHGLGTADMSHHFIVISEGALSVGGIPVTVLAKSSPFTSEEEKAVKRDLEEHPRLEALYLPSHPGSNAFSRLIASNDAYAFGRDYAYDVTPVGDNSPFFFFTIRSGKIFREIFLHGHGIDWKPNLGVFVLALVLLISAASVLIFLLLPLALGSRSTRQSAFPLLYFIAIGLGYIFVEITFIQHFVLFLGHPTYAVTVVIFLLLLSSGVGSLLSSSAFFENVPLWIPLATIIPVLVAYVLILPKVLPIGVGLGFGPKLLVSSLFLLPVGFAMGMPFPNGLSRVSQASPNHSHPTALGGPSSRPGNAVEWAWAMNATASVLGSALAMTVAIRYGLKATLCCGAAAYLLALILTRTLPTRESSTTRSVTL